MSLIARRFLSLIVLLLLASLIIFVMASAMPGDAAIARAGGENASPELVDQLRKEYGLDRPLIARYGSFVSNALRGDLGTSFSSGEPVSTVLLRGAPATFSLIGLGFAVALLIAVPSGVMSALRPGSWMDRLSAALASFGVAVPNFWLGLTLVLVFALWIPLLPATGYVPLFENPWGWFTHLILPAITLGTALSAELSRQIRASLADTLKRDFVRTMRAIGLRERSVIGKHAMRSALAPVLSTLGIQVAIAFAATVVIETVFNITGLGTLMVRSVFARDEAVLQGVMMFSVVVVAGTSFVVDALYGFVNPRVRVE